MHIPRALGWLFVTVLLSNAQEVAPGIVNYSEGQVSLHGQILETGQGRAEVLLTAGVYLRIDEQSAIEMENGSASEVKLELVRGQALVEVDQVDEDFRLHLIAKGVDLHIDRSGLYFISAGEPAIAVYCGKVSVEDDRRRIHLNRGEELRLDGARLKAQKFDRSDTGAIYSWSEQRARYASQISEVTGESLLLLDGQASYSQGWYWNPWYKSWAFIPKAGYVLTPFGYGLYAPQMPHFQTPVFADFRN